MSLKYKRLIDKFALSQGKAADFLGITIRTSARYASKTGKVPKATIILLQLMERQGLTPDAIEKIIKGSRGR